MVRRLLPLLFLSLPLVYALGAVLDVMEVDAAQYAAMARQLAAGQGDWLHFHFRGQDYLDKPPLLFWLSALSFKLFGMHNWSYKLPSIAAALFALFATYRLGRLHRGAEVGRRAALMLGTSLAMVLMTNDVRCDTLLMAAVVTAIWCGAEHLERPRITWAVGAGLAVGAGMLAKGPIGLMSPLLALGGHVLLKRRWEALLDLRLLVVPLVAGLMLLPMLMGLYEQFGAHGPRFFFWEQSFGRITGENVWKDDTGPFYFAHELLWQLLPWTLFVLVGMGQGLQALFGKGRRAEPEWIALSGSLLVTLALSASQFKLPHYLYVVHPLFCLLGAQAGARMEARGWTNAQLVLMVALVAVGAGTVLFAFPSALAWLLAVLALLVLIVVAWRGKGEGRGVVFTAAPMVLLATLLNTCFYPPLLRYQATARIGKELRAQGVPPDRFLAIGAGGTALDLYYGKPVRYAGDGFVPAEHPPPGSVVLTDDAGLHDLRQAGMEPRTVQVYEDFRVQLLSLRFLDPATRAQELTRLYLLRY